MRLLGSRLPAFLLLCLALLIKLNEPRALENLRLTVFDTFQRLFPREYQEVGVRIVDIDDETLRRVGQWPWSRLRVAELIDRLHDYGAAAIGFDMVFAEQDRLSPERIEHDLAGLIEPSALETLAAAVPESDAVLAESLARATTVTGFVLVGTPTPNTPVHHWGVGHAGDDPRLFLRAFGGAITNLPELETAANGNGSFNAIPDDDGTIRRVFLMFRLGDDILPALSMELLRVVQGASTYLIRSSGASGSESFGASTGINAVKVGALEIPTDAEGAIWLHYTGPRKERYVPAWQILDGSVDPAKLRGHIVLLGTSAAGLKDQRASPLDPAGPGVEIHAQALEQILLGVQLVRPDWAVGAEFVFILLLGGILVYLMPRLSPGICLGAGVLSVLIAFGGSLTAYLEAGLLFDPLMPAVAVLLIYVAGSFSGYIRTEAERSRVRSAFSHYLAPEMVETLARSSDRLQLGGEQRELTLMFTDIRQFSRISQRFTPTELTKILNRFFTPMTEIIQERKGTIDKYIGDCIMAFWNAPLDDAQHAEHACRSGLRMLEATRVLDGELRAQFAGTEGPQIDFRIGIGLNSGPCLVGNMGSSRRFNYTALGHAVNLAQRIETQCKSYKIELIVSETTAALCSSFALLPLDRVLLAGSETPTLLFSLAGDEKLAASEGFARWKALHEEMIRAYLARDFDGAGELARQAKALADARHQTLYEIYQARFLAFEANPPDPDWDGVVVSLDK